METIEEIKKLWELRVWDKTTFFYLSNQNNKSETVFSIIFIILTKIHAIEHIHLQLAWYRKILKVGMALKRVYMQKKWMYIFIS